MSSSDRRLFLFGLLGATATVSGCFRPMLAEDGDAALLRNKIALPTIDGRFGYFLNRTLEDRLGYPQDPTHRLEIKTNLTERGLAVAQDNSVTRVTIVATADWTLVRNSDAASVASDKVTTQSGYGATTSLFATRQARRDIERRLARDLGERVARNILSNAARIAS